MIALEISSLLWIFAPVVLLGLIGVVFVYLYNRLHKYSNAAEANLGQIKVAMKKRLDMIEQLLGSVKGYAEYERGVFKQIAEMRARLFESGAGGLDEIDKESRAIVGGVVALAEGYPELKASETIKRLMDAILSVEEEIARHRYTYNNIIQELNTMVDTIPSNLIASSAGIGKHDYLEFEESIESPPEIKGIAPS